MGTKRITLTGKANWAKVFESNRDMVGYDGVYREYDGAYTIQVELDKTNYDILESSGSAKANKSRRKEVDKLDSTEVKFVRKHKDRFEWASGAPKVLKSDGSDWDFSEDGLIGNGSTVEVELSVYTTTKSPGTRLESVKVLDLVGYDEFKEPVKYTEHYAEDSEEVPF